MLVAQDLGYQSCPIIGFDIDEIAGLVRPPEGFFLGPMVAIGKGVKEAWPKPGQPPLKQLVFETEFWGPDPSNGGGHRLDLQHRITVQRSPSRVCSDVFSANFQS